MGSSGKKQAQKRHGDKIAKKVHATDDHNEKQFVPKSIFRPIFIAILAVLFGVVQRNHVATMFENDRHFSHLSDMEREMTFRTEMGLYYSYFKTMIRSPTFYEGLLQITRDNVTEYGHTINTLKRFNLYPELILAALYRAYVSITKHLNINTQECWRTDRGHGLEPIISCEGMGNQYYFYVNFVFATTALVGSALFLYGVLLSDSIFGGLIAVAGFFFNHGEATRVQWTPPLRESFGYPIFLVQMLVVSYVIKRKSHGIWWSVCIAFFTVLFMLFWQFASFALSTQVGSIFLAFTFGFVSAKTLGTISVGLLMGFGVSFVLLFGNEMLLTSLFLSSLITIQAILAINRAFEPVHRRWRFIFWCSNMVFFAVCTLGIKFCVSNLLAVKDDAHVFDMLRSKFTNYSDFHTRLYTCAAEFDFMQMETVWKLTKTCLLPAAAVALISFAIVLLKTEFQRLWAGNRDESLRYGEVFYNVIQFGTFAVMAVLIMRLKLFFTPHLCIVASLLASRQMWNELTKGRLRVLYHRAACVLLLGLMAVEGMKNLQHQWGIKGEYSNVNQEQLLLWVKKNTPNDAVFAGPMPTMANLKLSTERPIVNHPHYEDAGLRERTMKVYSIFSRKPAAEVHKTLKDMGVNYVIFEYGWCTKGGRPGCGLPELWDLHDIPNRGKTPLCDYFRAGNFAPFELVFQTDYYKVLKVQ